MSKPRNWELYIFKTKSMIFSQILRFKEKYIFNFYEIYYLFC